MLVAERYEKIVQVVNERGSIRVSELSELCQVTEETIRRDLDRLEQDGRLRRSHGGAVSVKENQTSETPFFERETMFSEEKKRIAREAINWIQPHDRIILDASTTAWYMASILPDIPLTVLTNSIKVAMELAGKEKVKVISTGGQLAKRSLSYVGPLAERSLDHYHVDKLFLSCKGVHATRGISESDELQAGVKQKMIELADQVILIADASKIGVRAFTQVGVLSDVDVLITDDRVTGELREQIEEIGISVKIV
ncbi:DeoR/GlpR family DNA-binding transcription regulator [Paenibacillus oryzisoli]|uniref:DeoR/GlpR family DNA-binding transcription regulator n=1 Tax=Paenibacillus oryzisoli TaxID=1850517 RepID=UPI003D29DDC5